MRINNNIMALNAHRQLSINNTNTKSLEKLSSDTGLTEPVTMPESCHFRKDEGSDSRSKHSIKECPGWDSLIQTAEVH